MKQYDGQPGELKGGDSHNFWIAEVKWNDDEIQYIGPFTEYDTGIKLWSAKFSAKYKGKFEYINYHKLSEP